jgi:hypothetical protein
LVDVALQSVQHLGYHPVRQTAQRDLPANGDRRLHPPELLLVGARKFACPTVLSPAAVVRGAVRISARNAFSVARTYRAFAESGETFETWLVHEILDRHIAPLARALVGAAQTGGGSRRSLTHLNPARVCADSFEPHPRHSNEVSQFRTSQLLPSEIACRTEGFGHNENSLVALRNDAFSPAEHGVIAREHQNLIVGRPVHRCQEVL